MSQYAIAEPKPSDVRQMKCLWMNVFGYALDDINWFFQKLYRPERSLIAIQGDKVLSMLYSIEYSAWVDGRNYKGAYLYAVATDESFRGCGLSSRLIQAHIEQLKSNGLDFAFLIPETQSLFSFYRRWGFQDALKRRLYRIENDYVAFPEKSYPDIKELYQRYLYHLSGRRTYIRMDFDSFAFTAKQREILLTDVGYVLYVHMPTGIDVRECAGDFPHWLKDTGETETTGMILPLNPKFPKNCKFELANLLN